METLPSYAKPVEYQLQIASPDDAQRNVMNLKLQAAPLARELWVGQVAFAAATHDDLRKFIAWLAQMDGRQTAFMLPAEAGILTRAGAHTATLASSAAAGDATLSLTVSPVSGTIKAGTLLTLGTNTADAYQVCEVLADVVVSGNPVSVNISPRMRYAFTAGATVTLGTTAFRLRLASDSAPGGHEFSLAAGVISLDVVEAVYA